jgi:phage minor structural protein
MTNTITGYMPYWEDDQKVVRRLSSLGFYDDVVLSDNYTDYAYKMIESLDVGSIYNDHKEDPAATLAQLIQDYAYEQLAKVSILPATIDVEFVSLNATDQYKSLMESRMIRLGDTVKVRYDALGIDEKQRVIKTVFNVLANRYESIEIGTKQIDLAGVIAKIAKRSK